MFPLGIKFLHSYGPTKIFLKHFFLSLRVQGKTENELSKNLFITFCKKLN